MPDEKQKYKQPKMISFDLGFKATSADRTSGLKLTMWNNMVTFKFWRAGEKMPENRSNEVTLGIHHLNNLHMSLANAVVLRKRDWELVKDKKKAQTPFFKYGVNHTIFNRETNSHQITGAIFFDTVEHGGALKVRLTLEKMGASYSVIFDKFSMDGSGSMIGLEPTYNPDDAPILILSKLLKQLVDTGAFIYNGLNRVAGNTNGYNKNNYSSGNNYNNRTSYDSSDKPVGNGDDIPF